MAPVHRQSDVAAAQSPVAGGETAPQIPPRWMNLIKRLLSLQEGRYLITLTVHHSGVDYSVLPSGKVEK